MQTRFSMKPSSGVFIDGYMIFETRSSNEWKYHLSVSLLNWFCQNVMQRYKWSLGLLESATDVARGRGFDKHGQIEEGQKEWPD